MSPEPRKVGTIARMFRDRVFGFIYCQIDERDYFFHQAQLENCSFAQLADGDQVTFIVGQGPNGKVEAQEIRKEDYQPQDGKSRADVGLPEPKRQSRYRRR